MNNISYNTTMHEDFPKIIFSEDEIQQRVREIGNLITNDFKDLEKDGIIVMSVLKGASIFMSDLIRNIDLKLQIDFMSISSYGDNTQSSGIPKIEKDMTLDISGKHIIIAEDIVDSGTTLDFLLKHFEKCGAKSITIATFLHKNVAIKDIPVKYKCFDCPNEFIVGYGLDYKQMYRNMPYVSGLGE